MGLFVRELSDGTEIFKLLCKLQVLSDSRRISQLVIARLLKMFAGQWCWQNRLPGRFQLASPYCSVVHCLSSAASY